MSSGDHRQDQRLSNDAPTGFAGDPERIRPLLARLPGGTWSVFETFAADGSLAIGISATPLPPGTLMVVYEGLTREVAERAAAGLHQWRLGQATD